MPNRRKVLLELKKISVIVVLVLTLIGCAGEPNNTGAEVAQEPQSISPFAPSETVAPSPTVTMTSRPTETATPTQTSTSTVTPTSTLTPTSTPMPWEIGVVIDDNDYIHNKVSSDVLMSEWKDACNIIPIVDDPEEFEYRTFTQALALSSVDLEKDIPIVVYFRIEETEVEGPVYDLYKYENGVLKEVVKAKSVGYATTGFVKIVAPAIGMETTLDGIATRPIWPSVVTHLDVGKDEIVHARGSTSQFVDAAKAKGFDSAMNEMIKSAGVCVN